MIKKILLTGDLGYIGTTLKNKLKKLKYNIIEYDIKRNKNEDIRIFKFNKKVDLVIHLAGIVGDNACDKNIMNTYKTNIKGTLNIIKYCKKHNIPLLLASSCSVYGQQEGIVYETSKLNPISLYALTKMLNENDCIEHLSNYIIMRFGTVFGLSKEYGYRENLVVNGMTKNAVLNNELIVFGGEQHRPFISVEELTNTIVYLIRSFNKHHTSKIYNLNAFNLKIINLGKKIQKIIGCKLKIEKRITDNRDYKVSNDKIKKFYKIKNDLNKEIKKIVKYLKKK